MLVSYGHRNKGELLCLNIGKLCEVIASEGKLFHSKIVVLKKENFIGHYSEQKEL